jgi:hypothetical protein
VKLPQLLHEGVQALHSLQGKAICVGADGLGTLQGSVENELSSVRYPMLLLGYWA